MKIESTFRASISLLFFYYVDKMNMWHEKLENWIMFLLISAYFSVRKEFENAM